MKTESQLNTLCEQAEKVCKENNALLTLKRRQVLSILLQADKAISAYEIIDLFKKEFNQVLAPMTTYRTLGFLERVQLVHKLNIANKYVACAHIGCDTTHDFPHFLICQRCLRVDELNSQTTSKLDELTDEVEQTGYQLSSPQIELNCICNACGSAH